MNKVFGEFFMLWLVACDVMAMRYKHTF